MYVVAEAFSDPAAVVAPEGLHYGTPCAFKGCAGFIHPAAGSTGVVLCSPWGFEDLVMRKSWRLLAEQIAAAGYPCVRFDYPGTGNALGRSISIDKVATWVDSIHDAAEVLRMNSGVRRFVFIGQSLGATLAAEAARTRGDVIALQLVAPVARGRHYVRELAATAKMVAARVGIEGASAPEEGMSVLGFGLSRALADDLKTLDLTRMEGLRVDDVTIFDSADRKAGAEVAERMRQLGLVVGFETVAPFHLMVSDATEIQPLPVPTDSVLAALQRVAPTIPAPTAAVPSYPTALVGDGFREEPIRFGAENALFGVLTRALGAPSDAPAVVLLNRGLNPHIGWRRVGVDHARALAAAGVTSLRFDAAGLGESRDEPGRPTHLIYSDALLADVRAAVDVLARRGHRDIALSGVCSGAYTALSAAQADARVTRVIAFNPQRFVWNPAESMEDVIRFGLRSMNDYVGDLKRGGALRKLVRSRHRIVPAMAFLLKRSARSAKSAVPLALRSLSRGSMAARVTRLFDTFAERRTQVAMVFTAGDPSVEELGAYFGPKGRDLRYPGVSAEIVTGFDHNFTSTAAADVMLDRMLAALGRRAAPAKAVRDAGQAGAPLRREALAG